MQYVYPKCDQYQFIGRNKILHLTNIAFMISHLKHFMNMPKRTIVALPGDGIGRVVLEETIRVLEHAGFDAYFVEGDIGWEFWKHEGNPLPASSVIFASRSGTAKAI